MSDGLIQPNWDMPTPDIKSTLSGIKERIRSGTTGFPVLEEGLSYFTSVDNNNIKYLLSCAFVDNVYHYIITVLEKIVNSDRLHIDYMVVSAKKITSELEIGDLVKDYVNKLAFGETG